MTDRADVVAACPEPQGVTAPRPDVDCLVVGGGPVGLLTAILLGRSGLQVSVVERWPQRYPLPRACTIDHEALRILQSAGLMADHAGLFEPSQGERGGYEFRNGAGDLLQAIDWNRASESGWANTNGFYQPDLEAVLEDVAITTPGVTVHRSWTFQSLTQDAQGVFALLAPTEQPAASPVGVRSRWLVGADGANSPVRSQLGLGVGDSGFQADWLVVDYEPLAEENWSAFVTQYCDPAQPATVVNSGPGRRRFEFMRRADVTPEELALESTAWRLMKPWGVTPETARLERHAVYTFRGRWAHTWNKGNVFLAGDAAHLMPPFLGQGLCSGLRDALALAWRLDLVHRGLASPSVCASYGPERTGHVREIIDEAVSAGRVICELDVDRAAVRDAELRRRSRDADALTREPPHPRLGEPSLTVASAGVQGRLAPQGRVRVADREGLFDDVVGGGWQLISRTGDPAGLLSEEDAAWFARIGGVTADLSGDGPVQDLDDAYAHWFAKHACTAVLARPDFYVFVAGEHGDVPGFLAQLRQALRTGFVRAGFVPE
ncbi:bifunctional 3-(3-hydroxy-phenyl)propionate/3-hydroxycinnamic acid hydroxylase [Streptomyces sp. NPDC102441]|uniref:bifunctional 3-(3-hydroxy-phenyl)propionate/3-hydroxycinnamic acid hydroxylase MhpA n=1 Tax=Streptomyces sp. NPDC102441 TaxID=3366176 RepID=UPI0037F2E7B3